MKISKKALAAGVATALSVGLFMNAGEVDLKTVCLSGTVNQRLVCAMNVSNSQFGLYSKMKAEQVIRAAVDRLGFGFSPQKSSLSSAVTKGQNPTTVLSNAIAADLALGGNIRPEVLSLFRRNSVWANFNQQQALQMYDAVRAIHTLLATEIKALETAGKPVPEEDRAALRHISNQLNRMSDESNYILHQEKLTAATFGSMRWSKADYSDLQDDQLNFREQISEFWFNHFNVDSRKTGLWSTYYDRDIRAKSFTTFRALLTAILQNPAMLVYLDNQSNQRQKVGGVWHGSNQNLARELLELHTLGKGPVTKRVAVDDYTQEDIEGVARILTGLTTSRTAQMIDGRASHFYFNSATHIPADVIPAVMGVKFSQAGVGKSLALAAHLANLPRTRVNICTKLTLRLAANHGVTYDGVGKKWRVDAHLNNLVNRCVAAWGNDGDLSAMYLAILSSPEYWHPARLAGSVKSPLELVVSAHRAIGLTPRNLDLSPNHTSALNIMANGRSINLASGKRLTQAMRTYIVRLGLPYRNVVPPTGYNENRSVWLNASYLINSTSVMHEIADHADQIVTAPGNVVASNLKGFAAHNAFDKIVDYSLGFGIRNPAGEVTAASNAVLRDLVGHQILATGPETLSPFFRARAMNVVKLDKVENLDLVVGSTQAANCTRKVGTKNVSGYCSSLRTVLVDYLTSRDFITK